LYYISPKGLLGISVPLDSTTPSSTSTDFNGLQDDVTDRLHCVEPSSGIQITTWTAPYFDLSRNGIIETICYKTTRPNENTFGRFCADVALPESAIFAQLAEADAALELLAVRVPYAICSGEQAQCNTKLLGTREKSADDDSMAQGYYEDLTMKYVGLS